MLLGKLELKLYTFTAIGNTEKEVNEAIVGAWQKFCSVEQKKTYGKEFASEAALIKSISYLQMDVGIAYRLYNNVPPSRMVKGSMEIADEKKPSDEEKLERKIKKQVMKKIIENMLNELIDD